MLEFIRASGIALPGICYEEGKPPIGKCRMCVVEISGAYRTACTVKIAAGLEVKTDSAELKKMREAYEKLLGKTELEPEIKKFVCVPSQACGILSLDRKKCILCGACVRACDEQNINSLAMVGRGKAARVETGNVPGFLGVGGQEQPHPAHQPIRARPIWTPQVSVKPRWNPYGTRPGTPLGRAVQRCLRAIAGRASSFWPA